MKLETTSPAIRTATFTAETASHSDQTLGWSSMTHFGSVIAESNLSLGWNAMPGFGETPTASGDAELVANFVRTTRLTETTPSMLASFWTEMSLLCAKA